jgi:hypothetical protein
VYNHIGYQRESAWRAFVPEGPLEAFCKTVIRLSQWVANVRSGTGPSEALSGNKFEAQ